MPENSSRAYVVFELAGASYAIDSEKVMHLEMVERVTPVPETLPYIDGVVFSRGQVLPALNLRTRFGFEKIDYSLSTRMIVCRVGERVIGFIVDSAREFRSISDESILPPPEDLSQISTDYLTGIVKLEDRLILILDLEEVLKPGDVETLPSEGDILPIASSGAEASESRAE